MRNLVLTIVLIHIGISGYSQAILYATYEDYLSKTGEVLVEDWKTSDYSSYEVVYHTNEGKKKIIFSDLKGWGMSEPGSLYRFLGAGTSKKHLLRYQVGYQGSYFVTYGGFWIGTTYKGLTSNLGLFGFLSAGLNGPMLHVTWANLAELVKDNQELYDVILERYGDKKSTLESEPNSDDQLSEYVSIMMQYEQSLKER